MDIKAKNILLQYKNILENNNFLETDIIGFLIFIREYVDKGKYNQIYDMCDFIAHRFRDNGIIVNNLNSAIKNNYSVNKNNKVIDVHGFEINKLSKKLIELCFEFGININKKIGINIMICYSSLLQASSYKLNNGKEGIVQFIKSVDNSLNICIKDNNINSPYICFMKIENCLFLKETNYGFIYDILYLKRDNNGKLIYVNSKDEDYIVFEGSD